MRHRRTVAIKAIPKQPITPVGNETALPRAKARWREARGNAITDNPYDPKFAAVSGNAAVGALTPVKKKDGNSTKDSSASTDAGNPDKPWE